MNCTECQDKLVAFIEGLLEKESSLQCRTHLDQCAACRSEFKEISLLQERLIARGKANATVSVVEPIMRRVLQDKAKSERTNLMSLFHTRWGIGLSAAAGIILVILSIFLVVPGGQATAAEILERGTKAISQLTSVHMQCRLRTLPNDNFSLVAPECDFVNVEIWREFGEQSRWRIDKPGRMAVMDGKSTIMVMKPFNQGVRIEKPTQSAFDTKWLLEVADASRILTNELQAIQAEKSVLELEKEVGADGRIKAVVSVESIADLPDGDYLKNVFFSTADTRRVYVFDSETDRLEAVKIYLKRPSGHDLVFETTRIDYNQPIDPDVFHPVLPESVVWAPTELSDVPNNEFYATLTPEQAAKRLFKAIGDYDWDEAQRFFKAPINDRFKQGWGGLEIVNIGKSFTSAAYPGVFVPYELILTNGENRRHNLALKRDKRTGRWIFDGGL